MRILLDTHAFLWAIAEPDRLGTASRRVIADRTNVVLVSAASAWEIGTKYRLGKLPQAEGLVQNFPAAVERLQADVLDITVGHSLFAGTLAWEHPDPFDRMLAAQSILDNLLLVTADDAFGAVPAVRTIW